jgi:SAM-dependent methyltransferase
MTGRAEWPKVQCSTRMLDRYVPGRAILDALRHEIQCFHGTVLDIGCGDMPYRSLLEAADGVRMYVGMDLMDGGYGRPQVEWDGTRIPFRSESIDCALATEVFEHMPHPEVVLVEVWRVLKPGGFLFLTVPFLWPVHDVPFDEYRYTPFALKRLLHEAGFDEVELRALGGWDASFAQMFALWVRRRPMARYMRRLLSVLALLVVKVLLRHDQVPEDFSNSVMITGLSGKAEKRV